MDAGKQENSIEAQQKLKEKMNWIFSSIYAYGSSNAIHILAAMQSENYKNAKMPEKVNKYRVMEFYVLLTAQIRADITGEIVSPEAWFKLKIRDFHTNRDMIKTVSNQLVEELDIDR